MFVSRYDQNLPSTRCLSRDLCWEWGFFFCPSYRKLHWKDQVNKQQPAFQTEWQWHLSVLVSELSLWTRLSPPSSPYHWLTTDLKALLPSPSEMMHCAEGVIIEDNILLKHSLKVEPRERSWLLHFLSAVARLGLHTESLGPLWAAGTISAPCLRLLPDCAYERKGGWRKENHSSHSGWRARTSNVPATPRAPFLQPSLGIPTSVPDGWFLWPCSPALTSIRLVKP